MIRFCDSEIHCIRYCASTNEYSESKEDLLSFFTQGHCDSVICVYDDTTEKFIGIITCQSLQRFETIRDAIRTEYLIWNKDIWKNAREYCRKHPRSGTQYLIPVLDKNDQLFCFAYEDLDANRELRMLRELTEAPCALQFTDIYPEYQYVRIYGFNELAYFTTKYLEQLGVAVEVIGEMWTEFSDQDECNVSYHKCMSIYAEGTWQKSCNWKENLLRSVSVEFECIDKAYEENVRKGFIKDADGDLQDLIDKLKNQDSIAVMGTDIESQNIYDYLKQRGVSVCCFVDGIGRNTNRQLISKPILTLNEYDNRYGATSVIIDNTGRHSASGSSANGIFNVDYLDYLGYQRNIRFFMFKDYFQVEDNSLETVLKNQTTILTGNIYLCERIADYYNDCQFLYLAILDDQIKKTKLKLVDELETGKDDFILVIEPEFSGGRRQDCEECKRRIIEYLDQYNFINYTDYFSYTKTWIALESRTRDKYPLDFLRVNKIVLGAIDSCCGNYFFEGLLDNHPNIILIHNENFATDLFWFCVQLAGRTADEKVQMLEQIFNSVLWLEDWKEKNSFIKMLSDIFERNEHYYTSQQMFILFHIVYMRLCGRNAEDPGNMLIYWTPHLAAIEVERYRQWLGADNMPCCIVNIVRNICMSKGSRIKGVLKLGWAETNYIYRIAIEHYDEDEDLNDDIRMVLRFEDIKCNPDVELLKFCRKLGIPWSDSLMSTTHHNGMAWVYDNGEKRVQDFDLTPVYNKYEEYFSEFDRFRIMLICASWQKRHGYPYVDILQFSRRELQEMFLKEFRFAEKGVFKNDSDKLNFYIGLQSDIRYIIRHEYTLALQKLI